MLYLSGARPPTDADRAITESRLANPDPTAIPGEMEQSPESTQTRLLAMPNGPEALSEPNRNVTPQPTPKFQTSLQLSPERETFLVNRALRRIDEVRREVGLDENNYVLPNSWMGIRQRNQASYDNDYSWRLALGGIFAKSNFSLGTNTRHVRFIAARVQDDLVGTSPFVGIMGRNPDKADYAKQVEEYVHGEIDRSPVRSGIRSAQKTALIVNDAIVKTAYHRDASTFWGPATVMINGFGEPLQTPEKKEYIFEDDNFLPHPAVEGLAILEKDPSFTMKPGSFGFQYFPNLEQTAIRYEGVKAESLPTTCFLCPLRYESIHDADINVHLYKKEPGQLRETYEGIDVSDEYFSWWDLTGDKHPKEHQGEHDMFVSQIVNEVTIAEVYIRCDANGDGRDEEILLVLDLQNQRPIFYDYLHNHFERRPFEALVGLEKVAGRWYGRGIFSLGEDQELHMDAEFNRAQVKGSRSSVITFRQKNAVNEWKNGVPTVIGNGDIHDLEQGFDSKNNPPIFNVNLSEDNDMALELMEISRQASDAVIGAISAADASQSDMNQSKTATGIVNLQQSGDAILKATEQDQAEGINAIMEQVVVCILEKMDKTRLILNENATELITLNRNEARALRRDVRLLLTRSKSTQLLNTAEKALMIAKDYRMVMAQDPEGARVLRPMYIDQLKALEVNSADEICPEITDEMIMAFQMQQQQQAAIEQQRAGEEHAAKIQKTLSNGNNPPQPD